MERFMGKPEVQSLSTLNPKPLNPNPKALNP